MNDHNGVSVPEVNPKGWPIAHCDKCCGKEELKYRNDCPHKLCKNCREKYTSNLLGEVCPICNPHLYKK